MAIKQIKRAVRKVRRYYGLGRYSAARRKQRLAYDRIPPFSYVDRSGVVHGRTRRGDKITGLSPRAKKARALVNTRSKKHARRRGMTVGITGLAAGGATLAFYHRKKKGK